MSFRKGVNEMGTPLHKVSVLVVFVIALPFGSGEFEIRPQGVSGFVIREKTAADIIALQMLILTAAEFGNSAEQRRLNGNEFPLR